MANPPGNYNLKTALNNANPAFRRARLGDIIDNLITAVNSMAKQADVGMALDAGLMAYGSGTLTVGGSVTNGNYFRVTFVNAAEPALISPGVIVGPVPIVTADTTTTVAAKLAAAINAHPILTSVGYAASSSAAVVTVKTTGVAGNSLVMTAQLSAGATISVTPVAPTGGTGAVPVRSATAFAVTPLSNIP